MATKNPVTGDELISRAPTEEYKAGWDRIFGRPVKTYTGGVAHHTLPDSAEHSADSANPFGNREA